MQTVPLIVPDLGTSDRQKIVVSSWLVGQGDDVVQGDRIVELLLDEVTFDVCSPATGRLVEILLDIDDTVKAGSVLGNISQTDGED